MNGGIAPHILNLNTRLEWVVRFTPQPLYPGERISGTHWVGGLVGPKAGLDAGIKPRSSSPSLITLLSYPASSRIHFCTKFENPSKNSIILVPHKKITRPPWQKITTHKKEVVYSGTMLIPFFMKILEKIKKLLWGGFGGKHMNWHKDTAGLHFFVNWGSDSSIINVGSWNFVW
jgi:hypothetical protein